MNRELNTCLSKKDDTLVDYGATALYEYDKLSEGRRHSFSAHRSRRHHILENKIKQRIVCEYFEVMKDDFLSFEGIIRDLNNDRLSFVAEKSIEEDLPVLIRHSRPFNNFSNNELDKGKHGRVVSCNKVEDQNGKSCFQIVIQYY
jgi:hypothetical protein